MDLDLGNDAVTIADLTGALENLKGIVPGGLVIEAIKAIPGLQRGDRLKYEIRWYLLVSLRPEEASSDESQGYQLGVFPLDQVLRGGAFLPESAKKRWVQTQFSLIGSREQFFIACRDILSLPRSA